MVDYIEPNYASASSPQSNGKAATMIEQLVKNYRIVSELGSGGMGQVYKAVHESNRRPAAIKVLKPELSRHGEIVQRFLNEALAANVIQHPNLVAIYETGFLSSGCAFIIMEYIEGESLRSYVTRTKCMGELPALLLVRQVASALAKLHEQDIIHRDLKADNVMLVADPDVMGGKRVKLLDFGLAKIAVRHQLDTILTRDGISMGTPQYMAPEQWISANTVDGKADIYSLGILLFLMVSGKYPHIANSLSEYQQHHLYVDPPLLSVHNPAASEFLTGLVRRMLAKKRANRMTAKELLNAVDAELERRGSARAKASSLLTSPPSVVSGEAETSTNPLATGSTILVSEGQIIMETDVKSPKQPR